MNKKQRRAAEKAEQVVLGQDTPIEAEAGTDLATADDAAFRERKLAEDSGEVGETTEAEGTAPAKADPNAESKAKAEANRKAKAERAEKELLAKYPHVVAVTQRGPNGPTRVRIRCTDPQTKQEDDKQVSVCEKEREIAVQDLFQVTRCVACQDRVLRKARRTRQSKKNKELRKFAREMKGDR
jgi:hypothetical protein